MWVVLKNIRNNVFLMTFINKNFSIFLFTNTFEYLIDKKKSVRLNRIHFCSLKEKHLWSTKRKKKRKIILCSRIYFVIHCKWAIEYWIEMTDCVLLLRLVLSFFFLFSIFLFNSHVWFLFRNWWTNFLFLSFVYSCFFPVFIAPGTTHFNNNFY